MECTQSCTYTWQTQNAWIYHKSSFTIQNGSRLKWRLLSWIVDLTYNSDTPVTLKLDGTQNWHSRSCLHWKPMLMLSPKTTSQVDRTEECWLLRFVEDIKKYIYKKVPDKSLLMFMWFFCSSDKTQSSILSLSAIFTHTYLKKIIIIIIIFRVAFFSVSMQLSSVQTHMFDWLMITYIALFSALSSRLTALACGSTWVTSFL